MKKFNQARVNGGSNYDSKRFQGIRPPATEVRVKRRKRRPLVGAPGAPATLSNCGNFLKPLATAARRKVGRQHQGNDLGDGNSAGDATMDNPQPSPKSRAAGIRMQFND